MRSRAFFGFRHGKAPLTLLHVSEHERFFDPPALTAELHEPAVFGTGMRGRPQVWPDIRMDVLREVNPDVAGWIHRDGSPLDYPIVKRHFDLSYYLSHNFSGEESLHDRVLVCCTYSMNPDLSDRYALFAVIGKG